MDGSQPRRRRDMGGCGCQSRVRGSRKGRRGEAGRSRSALSRAMMGDMSDDQPWAGRFTLGTACGLAGDGESGRLGLWEGDSERQESLWIRCRSRVRTTSDGESSIDMEPVTLSLDNYESGGRSVHDDIRDCLAGYAKLPTPMPMPTSLPTDHHLPTMCRRGWGAAAGHQRPLSTNAGLHAQADGICRARRKATEAEAGDGRWKVRSQKVFCARCEWPSYHLVVRVLVASVLVRFLVCLLRSLVVLLDGVPGGPGWQSCWSLSFPPPALRPLSSNPSLPPVLLRAPVPRESPPVLCAEPAVRRHLAFVSLSPRALSREPCRPPLPPPPPVCLPVLVRPEGGEHGSHVHTVALLCGPGHERSGCTLNQHTHDRSSAVAFPCPVLLFPSVSVQLSCWGANHDCGSLLALRCRNPM